MPSLPLFTGIRHLHAHVLAVPPTKACLLCATPASMDLYIYIYTSHACRHLPSAVPWISEDRLFLALSAWKREVDWRLLAPLTVARYVRIMIYRSVAFLASAVSCGPSPIPVNTQASAATGTYGDVVTYTCIAGYNQSGGGTGRRTCDSSGSWVVDGGDSDPVCSREMQILHSRKIKIKDRLILDIYHPVNRVRHELSRAKHIPSDGKKCLAFTDQDTQRFLFEDTVYTKVEAWSQLDSKKQSINLTQNWLRRSEKKIKTSWTERLLLLLLLKLEGPKTMRKYWW